VIPLPDARLKEQLLELARAPRSPLDLQAYDWREVAPGIRFHLLAEDPARHLQAGLIWARPGARHPRHRHHGEEVVLVLEGRFKDERGAYGPGEICRSLPGSVHSEAVEGDDDCVCFVLYYGALEALGND
jgi:putative transcriptional regulator